VKNAVIAQEIPDEIGLLKIVTDTLDDILVDELQTAVRS
jgi:hypothetical protein